MVCVRTALIPLTEERNHNFSSMPMLDLYAVDQLFYEAPIFSARSSIESTTARAISTECTLDQIKPRSTPLLNSVISSLVYFCVHD